MSIGWGKYAEKTVEELVFKHPDYVSWLSQQQNLSSPAQATLSQARKIIEAFDKKAFISTCYDQECGKQAPVITD